MSDVKCPKCGADWNAENWCYVWFDCGTYYRFDNPHDVKQQLRCRVRQLESDNHAILGLLKTACDATETNGGWSYLDPEWFRVAKRLTADVSDAEYKAHADDH